MNLVIVKYWWHGAIVLAFPHEWAIGVGYNLDTITLGSFQLSPRQGVYVLSFLLFFVSIGTPGWERSPL